MYSLHVFAGFLHSPRCFRSKSRDTNDSARPESVQRNKCDAYYEVSDHDLPKRLGVFGLGHYPSGFHYRLSSKGRDDGDTYKDDAEVEGEVVPHCKVLMPVPHFDPCRPYPVPFSARITTASTSPDKRGRLWKARQQPINPADSAKFFREPAAAATS